MTATAEITTKSKPNVLLVPNAALRFTPTTTPTPAASSGGGITGALTFRRPRGGGQRSAGGATGASQTVYVLGDDGKPQAIPVQVGDTNGTVTEVTGGALKPGMKVITGQLSSTSTGAARQGGGQRRQGAGGAGAQGGGQRGGQ